MEDKKYSLTLSDIKMLIGLGANAVCEENELDYKPSEIVTSFAADIYRKVENLLTGICRFSEEEITGYELILSFLDLMTGEK